MNIIILWIYELTKLTLLWLIGMLELNDNNIALGNSFMSLLIRKAHFNQLGSYRSHFNGFHVSLLHFESYVET